VKKWIDRVFWLNLYLFKSPELISRKKWQPGPEASVLRTIQGNRSYHGLTDQFNVSNGSISNVVKFFIASGKKEEERKKKKLQIATLKQDKLLQTRKSSKRIYRRKTWFQSVLPPPKEGYGMLPPVRVSLAMDRSFIVKSVDAWNSLPYALKLVESHKTLMTALKKHFSSVPN
jgi:hypothetical protein